jgi:hypothetical protein
MPQVPDAWVGQEQGISWLVTLNHVLHLPMIQSCMLSTEISWGQMFGSVIWRHCCEQGLTAVSVHNSALGTASPDPETAMFRSDQL